MSFLKPLLGGPAAGALGGAITPVSGIGMAGGPLSGLGALKALFGGDGGSAPAPKQPEANAAATGLGKLIGVEGGRVSEVADRIGKGMNQIAQGGGALPSYSAPELPAAPPVNNQLQLLNNDFIQALLRQFGGAGR